MYILHQVHSLYILHKIFSFCSFSLHLLQTKISNPQFGLLLGHAQIRILKSPERSKLCTYTPTPGKRHLLLLQKTCSPESISNETASQNTTTDSNITAMGVWQFKDDDRSDLDPGLWGFNGWYGQEGFILQLNGTR